MPEKYKLFVYLNMELLADVEFNKLLKVIRDLPEDKKMKLKAELLVPQLSLTSDKFPELLLVGPVMSNQQFETHKQSRNHFNKWRTK